MVRVKKLGTEYIFSLNKRGADIELQFRSVLGAVTYDLFLLLYSILLNQSY